MSIVFLLTTLISVAAIIVIDNDHSSMLTRGDFPGFYAPAVILAAGLPERLYDQRLQAEVQNEAWPSLRGRYLSFAYPPFTALLLRPFALFGPLSAKALATALLVATAILVTTLFCRLSGVPPGFRFPASVGLLAQGPILVSLLCAQNTLLSMLCYLVAFVALKSGTNRGEYLAGIALGAWLFKPQFALIALAFFAIARKHRILIGACLPTLLYSLASTLTVGPGSFKTWIQALRGFSGDNYIVNGRNMVSLLGFGHVTARVLDVPPEHAAWIDRFVLFLSAILFGIVIGRFLRGDTREGNREALLHAYALLGPAIVLVSPQTLFYDLGLAILPCGFYLKPRSDRAITCIIMATLLLWSGTAMRFSFPLPLLTAVGVMCFIFIFLQTERLLSTRAPA